MNWFNYYGLGILLILMIPNIISAKYNKEIFTNYYSNQVVIKIENVFRIGTFILMIFNIPFTYLNFFFNDGLKVYLIINGSFILIYLLSWIIFWNQDHLLKILLLTATPSLIFLISGILILNFPLMAFAVGFGFFHIYLSIKNLGLRKLKHAEY